MPGLPKGAIPVPFGQGVDTKTGKQRTQKLLALENAYFSKGGELAKRWGFNSLGAPSPLGTGDNFLNFDNDLAAIVAGSIKSYSPSAHSWVDKGSLLTAGVKTSPLAQINTDLTLPDAATLNGVTVHAYMSGTTLFATVVDETTGATLVQNKQVAVNAAKPRCAAFGGMLYIFWVSSLAPTLYYVGISPNTPTSFPVQRISNTDLSASKTYALGATANFLCLVYDGQATTGVALCDALPADGPLGPRTNTQTTTLSGRFGVSVSALDVAVGSDGNIYVAATDGTTVFAGGYQVSPNTASYAVLAPNFTLSQRWADVTVGTSSNVKQITLAPANATTSGIDVYFETAPTTKTTERVVNYAAVTTATGGVSRAPTVFLRSVGLASRAFYVGAPSTRSTVTGAYVGITYDSVIQPTFFLASRTGTIVSRFSSGKAGGLTVGGGLPSVVSSGTSTFVAAVGVRGGLSAIAKTGTSTVRGVERVVFNFDQRYRNAQLGRNAHVGGGRLKIYDSSNVVEQGFQVFPEAPAVQGSEFQLQITTADVPGSTPQVVQITPPPDIASGANSTIKSGAQIRPGQYFILWAPQQQDGVTIDPFSGSGQEQNVTTPVVVWFVVDGVGSQPRAGANNMGSANVIYVRVDLTSTDSQSAVVTKIAQALNLKTLPFTAAPVTGNNAVAVTSSRSTMAENLSATPKIAATKVPPPIADSMLLVTPLFYTQGFSRLVTPAAAHIRSGQSFVLEAYATVSGSNTNVRWTFYFVRTDVTESYTVPTIPGTAGTTVINILSTDDELAVRNKAASAITSATYNGATLFTNQAGNAVTDFSGTSSVKSAVNDPANIDVGGAMEDGTHSYYATYSWTDAQGQRHRSAPSLPASALTNTSGRGHVFVTVPTLRLTDRINVTIDIFRTTLGTAVAQKVATLNNDPTIDSVSFYDALRDADIAFGEFLYTTGGVLPNIAPPPAQVVHNHRSRLVLGAIDVPNTIWYSKNFVDGSAVAFSDLLTLRLDDVGGDVTALATLDDKLIIFKAGRVYFVAGDGPNDLGQQNTFTPPMVIASDAGCISPESVVLMPRGLMFQSAKGIYLLDRNMQLSYIGAPVEDLVTGTITGAVLMPNATRVQFTLASGKAIYYDYYFDQWGTATNHDAQAAKVFNGTFVMMKSTDGSVWQEAPASFSDAGLAYAMKVQTPWIKPAGLQGFFRLRKFSFLGTYVAGHQMQVDVAYDYSEASTSYLFNAEALYAGNIYGTGTPYGTGTYGGYNTEVYQFSVQPAQQKCESVRFTFTDTPGLSTLGNSYVIADLNLEIAVKDGSYRFPGTQRTG